MADREKSKQISPPPSSSVNTSEMLDNSVNSGPESTITITNSNRFAVLTTLAPQRARSSSLAPERRADAPRKRSNSAPAKRQLHRIDEMPVDHQNGLFLYALNYLREVLANTEDRIFEYDGYSLSTNEVISRVLQNMSDLAVKTEIGHISDINSLRRDVFSQTEERINDFMAAAHLQLRAVTDDAYRQKGQIFDRLDNQMQRVNGLCSEERIRNEVLKAIESVKDLKVNHHQTAITTLQSEMVDQTKKVNDLNVSSEVNQSKQSNINDQQTQELAKTNARVNALEAQNADLQERLKVAEENITILGNYNRDLADKFNRLLDSQERAQAAQPQHHTTGHFQPSYHHNPYSRG